MSPHTFRTPASDTIRGALSRFWVGLGIELRDARLARKWTVRDLARRAGISAVLAYKVEAGRSTSTEAAIRLSGWPARWDCGLTSR